MACRFLARSVRRSPTMRWLHCAQPRGRISRTHKQLCSSIGVGRGGINDAGIRGIRGWTASTTRVYVTPPLPVVHGRRRVAHLDPCWPSRGHRQSLATVPPGGGDGAGPGTGPGTGPGRGEPAAPVAVGGEPSMSELIGFLDQTSHVEVSEHPMQVRSLHASSARASSFRGMAALGMFGAEPAVSKG